MSIYVIHHNPHSPITITHLHHALCSESCTGRDDENDEVLGLGDPTIVTAQLINWKKHVHTYVGKTIEFFVWPEMKRPRKLYDFSVHILTFQRKMSEKSHQVYHRKVTSPTVTFTKSWYDTLITLWHLIRQWPLQWQIIHTKRCHLSFHIWVLSSKKSLPLYPIKPDTVFQVAYHIYSLQF